MSHLLTWWYNCPHFWTGTFVVSSYSNFELNNFRLPILANDSQTQAILSHAGILLVLAVYCPRLPPWETLGKLQNTCYAPHHYFMAHWVCLWFVCSHIFPFTLLFTGGVTASTSHSSGMLYMPPWMFQTFYLQLLKCLSISIGSKHKLSCLLSLSWSGCKYDLVSPCTSTAHTLFRYFRHYLNLVMLYSAYKDFNLILCMLLFHIYKFTCLITVI